MDLIESILSDLGKLGIRAFAQRDKIGLEPASKVPSDLKEKIKQHKLELIQALQAKSNFRSWEAPKESCYTCGDYNWWLSIHNVWVCGTCHPPATKELVKQAIGVIKIANKVLH